MGKGIFSKKSIESKRKDEEAKRLKREKEAKHIQIQCNHIDADTNKGKLKDQGNGTHKCKLCKAVVTTDPKIVNPENITEAVDMVYSAVSIIRYELSLKEKFDRELVNAMETISVLPTVFEEMLEKMNQKHKNHKNKNKKHHGNGRKHEGKKRVKY